MRAYLTDSTIKVKKGECTCGLIRLYNEKDEKQEELDIKIKAKDCIYLSNCLDTMGLISNDILDLNINGILSDGYFNDNEQLQPILKDTPCLITFSSKEDNGNTDAYMNIICIYNDLGMCTSINKSFKISLFFKDNDILKKIRGAEKIFNTYDYIKM